MKTVKKGDVINFKGFTCEIIKTGVDYETGEEIATLKPTDFNAMPLDVVLSQHGMKLAKDTKTKQQITKQNIIIIKAMLKSDDVLSGGIDNELEEYYMKRYNRTQQEMSNLLLIAHAIINNDEIELVEE